MAGISNKNNYYTNYTSPPKFYNNMSVAYIRSRLMHSWQYPVKHNPITLSPSRAAYHNGDLLSRQNYTCGGPNPIHSHPQIPMINNARAVNNCDNSGIQPHNFAKFVPDSSTYIQFKKEAAILANFNDISNGGDNYNASQTPLRWSKHF